MEEAGRFLELAVKKVMGRAILWDLVGTIFRRGPIKRRLFCWTGRYAGYARFALRASLADPTNRVVCYNNFRFTGPGRKITVSRKTVHPGIFFEGSCIFRPSRHICLPPPQICRLLYLSRGLVGGTFSLVPNHSAAAATLHHIFSINLGALWLLIYPAGAWPPPPWIRPEALRGALLWANPATIEWRNRPRNSRACRRRDLGPWGSRGSRFASRRRWARELSSADLLPVKGNL